MTEEPIYTELFSAKSPISPNLDYCVRKIKRGMFNCILVFGPSRAGKSTLAMQCGTYIAERVGVKFDNDSIFFSAEKLEQTCSAGNTNAVYMLDEAAFDMTGEDWQKDAQKKLKTFFSVAAKYNNTFILLIPHIEELRKYFVINEHTRGIEVVLDRKTLERGRCKLHTRYGLQNYYWLRKMNHYVKAEYVPAYNGNFRKTIPSNIDLSAYENEKDYAILSSNSDNSASTRSEYIKRGLKLGLSAKDLSEMFGLSLKYVYNIKGSMKPLRLDPIGAK